MVVYYFKYPGTHDIGLSSTRVSARMKPLFSGAITPQSNRRHPWYWATLGVLYCFVVAMYQFVFGLAVLETNLV